MNSCPRNLFTGTVQDSTLPPGIPMDLRISAGTLVQKITKLSKESNFVLTTITTDWRDLASCRDSEPTLFFPVGTTGPAVGQIDAAIAICSTCIVQEDCLQYALETNQESGVWGGYAEEDRRRLRKRWLAERRRRAV